MGDLHDPATEAAPLRIERGCFAPDRQEYFLYDFLCRSIIKRLSGQMENEPGVAAVEYLERILLPSSELRHQLDITLCMPRNYCLIRFHTPLPHHPRMHHCTPLRIGLFNATNVL